MKKIIIAAGILIGIVILVGMFKFNILANLDGYDVDGNNEQYSYVIETPVSGPEECLEQEEYDEENQTCFVECASADECDEIEEALERALDDLEGDYQEFAKNFTEFDGDFAQAEEKAEVTYKIEKGEHFIVISGEENAQHAKIKAWLAKISPDQFSDTYLNRLILLSDTSDDSAAFVAPSDTGENDGWDIFVSMKSMTEDGEREMVFTLIHEYAHILTLNNSQMNEDVEEGACQNYVVDEGCLKKDAYLNKFYQKFWKGKFKTEVDDSLENYDQQPSAFVTEYAATNPGEDIAETFASFIFKKKTQDQTVAGQKLNFFYTYPQFIQMRNDIREMFKPFVRQRMRS